jgi:hypothetical protein
MPADVVVHVTVTDSPRAKMPSPAAVQLGKRNALDVHEPLCRCWPADVTENVTDPVIPLGLRFAAEWPWKKNKHPTL